MCFEEESLGTARPARMWYALSQEVFPFGSSPEHIASRSVELRAGRSGRGRDYRTVLGSRFPRTRALS